MKKLLEKEENYKTMLAALETCCEAYNKLERKSKTATKNINELLDYVEGELKQVAWAKYRLKEIGSSRGSRAVERGS